MHILPTIKQLLKLKSSAILLSFVRERIHKN